MAQMVVFHGIALPQGLGITEEKVAVFPTLPARKDDIFIASYPRSGLFPLSLQTFNLCKIYLSALLKENC